MLQSGELVINYLISDSNANSERLCVVQALFGLFTIFLYSRIRDSEVSGRKCDVIHCDWPLAGDECRRARFASEDLFCGVFSTEACTLQLCRNSRVFPTENRLFTLYTRTE